MACGKTANRLGNESSLIIIFQENEFKVLFNGDATNDIWNGFFPSSLTKVDILKVPHHGSKNGLSQRLLRLAEPQLAVISVGKNNAYGHPPKKHWIY
jgi:competence protein ComEC